MITLDEFIGFPVPKEHREELWKRLCSYSAMEKKELMSLLLQYDWENLQCSSKESKPQIVFKDYLTEVGERIQAALEATHSAQVIAEMKREHSPEFFKMVYEMRNAQMDEALKCALYHEKSFLGLRTIRTKKDLEKATERRVLAECEVDEFIKEHKEDFKQWEK